MAALGFAGLFCPEEFGGTQVGFVGSVGVFLGRSPKACASTAGTLAVHALIQEPIARHGTEHQKKQFLPPLTDGRFLGAFAITEPGRARMPPCRPGLEGRGIPTRSMGAKIFITSGGKQIFTW